MKIIDQSLEEFVETLRSKRSIPGGGEVLAYVAALGTSLFEMCLRLTIDKQTNEEVKQKLEKDLKNIEKYTQEFLEFVDLDAESFFPLSQAYKMPDVTEKEKDKKKKALAMASLKACEVPYKTMALVIKSNNIIDIDTQYINSNLLSDLNLVNKLMQTAFTASQSFIFTNKKYFDNSQECQIFLKKYHSLFIEEF